VRVLSAIPAGVDITLATSARRNLVAAASTAAASLVGPAGGPAPDAMLLFSCTGRYLALGRRTADEVEAVRERLAPGRPLFGFHSGAEFSPETAGRGRTIYNAYSATLVALGGGGNRG
jgi:hypothetical protein